MSTTYNVKELKYNSTQVLVEIANKALQAKADAAGNVIVDTYATKEELIHIVVVNSLPAVGQFNYIYLVANTTQTSQNKYSEYIWIKPEGATTGSYEKISGEDIDISGKLDKLTTTGLHVYVHNGTSQTELGIDSTSGGTASSGDLITSGAVASGLSTLSGAVDTKLEDYTKTEDLGALAMKDTLASTELSDSNSLVRTTDVANNVTTTTAGKVLDARQGKTLQDEIDNLKAIGRYLSSWNTTTGKPGTDPTSLPYNYKTGDYYIIGTVAESGGTNYKPNGSSYTGAASTTVETQTVKPNDYYRFDGNTWQLEINTQRVTTWGSITGTLSNQTDLQGALDNKADDEDIIYSNDSGTTVAVGGIAKGTTFTNKSLKDIIEDMLYPYVAFTFNSVSTTPTATTYEYGDDKTITKLTPNFTKGSKNITSVKIGSTSGGQDLYSGSSATSGTAITLTSSKSLDGKSNFTIYCTLSDGTNSTTKSATFTFSKYYYYSVTASTTAPTTGTKIGTSATVDSITTTDNSYIWFLSPVAKTKIQQFSMNQWNDMATTAAGTVTFTTSTSESLTYYAYRTDKMVAATGKYQLA